MPATALRPRRPPLASRGTSHHRQCRCRRRFRPPPHRSAKWTTPSSQPVNPNILLPLPHSTPKCHKMPSHSFPSYNNAALFAISGANVNYDPKDMMNTGIARDGSRCSEISIAKCDHLLSHPDMAMMRSVLEGDAGMAKTLPSFFRGSTQTTNSLVSEV